MGNKETNHSGIGVFSGESPSAYNPENPITLFIIQCIIIIGFCRLVHLPLSRLKQPRVIAEIIAGILLGPSALGKVPYFNNHIFPKDSLVILNLASNIGLVFFLFVVGMEVDIRVIRRHFKAALSVGLGSLLLPFAGGVVVAYGLNKEFNDNGNVNLAVFFIFIGTAFSITAFPVLARILTELKLLQENVGIVVLSAGVGNDMIGWVLLALTIALVHAGNGIISLYVLLLGISWVLILIYIIRPIFIGLVKKTKSLENGPTEFMIAITFFLVLGSAFVTDVIGVHPIFGGFLAGLIIPHIGDFAVKVTEKVEDLITILFLPLYFASSGLKTDITLLNDKISWAWTICIIFTVIITKVIGSSLAARINGLLWRESFTIGVLMSCRGLIELIVLNVGLTANILNSKVFTMFVVNAVITTSLTTPSVLLLYPLWYREKVKRWRAGEIDWNDTSTKFNSKDEVIFNNSIAPVMINKLMVVLNRVEHLPPLMAFIRLLSPTSLVKADHLSDTCLDTSHVIETIDENLLSVHGLRLIELTQRTSAIIKVSDNGESNKLDPLMNVFRTFVRLNRLRVSGCLKFVSEEEFSSSVVEQAKEIKAGFLIIPWSTDGSISDESERNFKRISSSFVQKYTTKRHNEYVENIFDSVHCGIGVLIDRGLAGNIVHESFDPQTPDLDKKISLSFLTRCGTISYANTMFENSNPSDGKYHLFFPFFGGEDDRAALNIVFQLVTNPAISATIVRIKAIEKSASNAPVAFSTTDTKESRPFEAPQKNNDTHLHHFNMQFRSDLPRQVSMSQMPLEYDETKYAIVPNSQSSIQSELDDRFIETYMNSILQKYPSRVDFETVNSTVPLQHALSLAKREISKHRYYGGGSLIILGRSCKAPNSYIRKDLINMLKVSDYPTGGGSGLRRCLGDSAEAFLIAKIRASILIVQAPLSSKC